MDAPFHPGAEADLIALRNYLQENGFNLVRVAERLQEEPRYLFSKFHPRPIGEEFDPADGLDLLIELFLRGRAVNSAQLRRWMPEEVHSGLMRLGLAVPYAGVPETFYSPVALCPVGNLVVACDRWSTPDQAQFKLAADAVYSPLTYNAQIFLDGIPRSPCKNLLDLCSGSGVAALLAAAGFAEKAVASDIAERCATFAEFNRCLNGLENLAVVQGDVYSGVAGQTFDRILAHPPYVPVLRPQWIYRDGGSDGEHITRGIVEGLPQFLAPGGIFYCHTMATDRDRSLEARIRQWLGESQGEFDVVLVIWDRLDPMRFAAHAALQEGGSQDFDIWKRQFEEWQVARMLDVSITVVRHVQAAAPLDIRRMGAPGSHQAEVEWLLAWERIAGLPQLHERLLQSRPVAGAGLKFVVTHGIEEGELRALDCRAMIEYPFRVDIAVDRWMPLLMAACDGRRTGLDLYDAMRSQGHVPADASPLKFGALLAAMVARGFIVIEECAPPALAGASRQS